MGLRSSSAGVQTPGSNCTATGGSTGCSNHSNRRNKTFLPPPRRRGQTSWRPDRRRCCHAAAAAVLLVAAGYCECCCVHSRHLLRLLLLLSLLLPLLRQRPQQTGGVPPPRVCCCSLLWCCWGAPLFRCREGCCCRARYSCIPHCKKGSKNLCAPFACNAADDPSGGSRSSAAKGAPHPKAFLSL